MRRSLWHKPPAPPETAAANPDLQMVDEFALPETSANPASSNLALLLRPWAVKRVVIRVDNSRSWRVFVTLLAFGSVFAFLCLWQASRLVLGTMDEGIILDASERMAAGQRLYVDFFGYMSPGSYWIQELMFRIFGISLWAARIPVLFDATLQCFLVYWLARWLLKRKAALFCAGFFLWFEIQDLRMLTAQHRFDSATLALAALCCAWRSRSGNRNLWLFASGCLAAAAAVCTPSVALLAVPILAWLGLDAAVRRGIPAWIGGAATVTALAAFVLWQEGLLTACVNQMVWLQQHYVAVNIVRYGAVHGGYADLLEAASGVELVVRCLILIWILIPAVVPILAVLWAASAMLSHNAGRNFVSLLTLLAASVVALLASTAPRPDIAHLAYIMAVPFVLSFAAVASLRKRRIQGFIVALVSMVAIFSLPEWAVCLTEKTVSTPVGTVRVAGADQPAVNALLAQVHRGDSLYVHPYLPLFYFLTQTRNPTRYSYLAPGMMTEKEESDALAELRGNPPNWILYLRVEPQQYLRVFPSADPNNVQFPEIEQWIAANYTATDVTVEGYRLMRRTARETEPTRIAAAGPAH